MIMRSGTRHVRHVAIKGGILVLCVVTFAGLAVLLGAAIVREGADSMYQLARKHVVAQHALAIESTQGTTKVRQGAIQLDRKVRDVINRAEIAGSLLPAKIAVLNTTANKLRGISSPVPTVGKLPTPSGTAKSSVEELELETRRLFNLGERFRSVAEANFRQAARINYTTCQTYSTIDIMVKGGKLDNISRVLPPLICDARAAIANHPQLDEKFRERIEVAAKDAEASPAGGDLLGDLLSYLVAVEN